MADTRFGSLRSYEFRCARCDKVQKPRVMRQLEGLCARCGPCHWTLSIDFSDAPYDSLAMGVAMVGGILGEGFQTPDGGEEQVTQFTFDLVESGVACQICNCQSLTAGLAGYTERRLDEQKEKHRELIKSRGGECPVCGALFVKNESKEWTAEGYCTKLCWTHAENNNRSADLQSGGTIRPVDGKQSTRRKDNKLALQCPQGHRFEVSTTYLGTKRACPTCGDKVLVE